MTRFAVILSLFWLLSCAVPSMPAGAEGKPRKVLRVLRDELINQPGVDRLAFSPDGKHLAAMGFLTLTLWDVESGDSRLLLDTRRGEEKWELNAVRFSPDGKTLAAHCNKFGRQDWQIRTWDPVSGGAGEHLASGGGGIEILGTDRMAFSADGSLLAINALSDDRKLCVTLINTRTREVVARLPDSWADDFALSPAGNLVAVGGPGRLSFDILDTHQRKLLHRIDGVQAALLAFTPSGEQLVTFSRRSGIGVWDPATGQAVRPHGKPKLPPIPKAWFRNHVYVDACLSDDAGLLAVPNLLKPIVTVYETNGAKLLTTFRTEEMPASLAFSKDNKTLAIGTVSAPYRLKTRKVYPGGGTEESFGTARDQAIELWDVPPTP